MAATDGSRRWGRLAHRTTGPAGGSGRHHHDDVEEPVDGHAEGDDTQGVPGDLPSIGPAEGTHGGAQGTRRPRARRTEAPLTSRQQRILEVIKESVELRGYPPSVREIGEAVGLTSPSSVAYQLTALQRKGLLRRDPNRPRAVDVRASDAPAKSAAAAAAAAEMNEAAEAAGHRSEPVNVPVLGRIAAGGPILAEQAIEDVFPLPREIVGEGNLFLLRVVGDSMVDAAICDGDWVVVRQQPDAESGDIVAAMLDGEATVKTLRRRDGEVWLMPHNDAYSPIPGGDATILGRVVTVLRRL
jgi:repressor LexA